MTIRATFRGGPEKYQGVHLLGRTPDLLVLTMGDEHYIYARDVDPDTLKFIDSYTYVTTPLRHARSHRSGGTMSKYPFDHIVTKLRTTRGSPFGRRVMDEAADEIERLQAKIDRLDEQVKRIQETIRPTGNPMDTLAEFRKLTALLNEETP